MLHASDEFGVLSINFNLVNSIELAVCSNFFESRTYSNRADSCWKKTRLQKTLNNMSYFKSPSTSSTSHLFSTIHYKSLELRFLDWKLRKRKLRRRKLRGHGVFKKNEKENLKTLMNKHEIISSYSVGKCSLSCSSFLYYFFPLSDIGSSLLGISLPSIWLFALNFDWCLQEFIKAINLEILR